MKIVFALIAIIALNGVIADYNPPDFKKGSLGTYVQHTLANIAKVPLTSTQAKQSGWTTSGNCTPSLGVKYLPKDGQKSDSPLALYFTPGGQIAGMNIIIYDGDAKSGQAQTQGYIKANDAKLFEINVSFRDKDVVCSNDQQSELVGDRLVINQDTIAKAIPLFADEAKTANFQAGSCMYSMGQHWLYDLGKDSEGKDIAPKMSWKAADVLPIIPMYHTTGSKTGQLNAFFFGVAGCQHDEGHNWDNVPFLCALNKDMMCKNLCNSQCTWDNDRFATYHVFFTEDLDSVKCAHPPSIFENFVDYSIGRDCPDNTPNPTHY